MSTTEIQQVQQAFNQPFRILDVYAPGGVSEAAPRMDALATISAGFKAEGAKFPSRSTDGTIYLSDPANRATGLKAALADAGNKQLTIAFPFDDLYQNIQMSFVEYSASSLKIYGDENEMTFLGPKGPQKFAAGTPEYERGLSTCKVSVSVYFHLAEWVGNSSRIVFPDGLGFYRLRFTSRNSLQMLVAEVAKVQAYTGGPIAGIPFQLDIENREVAAPTGERRKVPVWRFLCKPPQELQFSTDNFREIANRALGNGAALMMAVPRRETAALLAHEGPDLDLDEVTEGVLVEGEKSPAQILVDRYDSAVAEIAALGFPIDKFGKANSNMQIDKLEKGVERAEKSLAVAKEKVSAPPPPVEPPLSATAAVRAAAVTQTPEAAAEVEELFPDPSAEELEASQATFAAQPVPPIEKKESPRIKTATLAEARALSLQLFNDPEHGEILRRSKGVATDTISETEGQRLITWLKAMIANQTALNEPEEGVVVD